ncbi:hypothetical protein BS50DRAFT_590335 [Corynespora cassiicola Philippines]|uniref:Uncharacterized protein n=1 Tax=Corynespora cassiicola Philippines TaxID=1448308 RepID=A0A2T2NGH2_CORCC|nr:hypothetical protein BS50DRAFT_590335 [Corynespora cassiicola Philippines]
MAEASDVSLYVAVDHKAILDIHEVWDGLRDHAKNEMKDNRVGEPHRIKAEVKVPIELTVTFVDNVKIGLAKQEDEKWLEKLKEIVEAVKDITAVKGTWDMLEVKTKEEDVLLKAWELLERRLGKQELATIIGEKPSKVSVGVGGDGDSHGD